MSNHQTLLYKVPRQKRIEVVDQLTLMSSVAEHLPNMYEDPGFDPLHCKYKKSKMGT